MKTASINSRYILGEGCRFEGKYFLNEHALLSMVLYTHSSACKPLHQMATVMNPPVFKRQFCQNTPNAVPYFQSSDVSLVDENSTVYVYRPQAESLNAIVNKGDILVTGFGTIGNTKLVSKHQDGTCYANNVARIKPNEGEFTGYIYAVMTSKYGVAQLNKNASGSVVRYIESPGIKRTLIPDFPKEFQQEVDDLIQSSARLREEAADLLAEAKKILLDYVNTPFEGKKGCKTAKRTLKDIRESLQMRLDPPALMNESVITFESIKDRCVKLGHCKVKTWYPGMFKRCYVADGLPYMQGSSVFECNPFRSCDHLSASRTPKLDELWLKDGLILISCAGTCGQVKLITKEYEDKRAIGSPDIIRLQSTDLLFTQEYLFVYLQLPIVQDYMQSFKYGSVIERFDALRVESIPVIIPTKELSEKITSLIVRYKDCTYQAFCDEEKAIRMVEAEIEKWNK